MMINVDRDVLVRSSQVLAVAADTAMRNYRLIGIESWKGQAETAVECHNLLCRALFPDGDIDLCIVGDRVDYRRRAG